VIRGPSVIDGRQGASFHQAERCRSKAGQSTLKASNRKVSSIVQTGIMLSQLDRLIQLLVLAIAKRLRTGTWVFVRNSRHIHDPGRGKDHSSCVDDDRSHKVRTSRFSSKDAHRRPKVSEHFREI